MESDALGDDVLRFIREHIDMVPQLEALILACETAPRGWSAAELAGRVYVSTEAADWILQDLESRRLLQRLPDGRYAFAADNPAAPLVASVATAYRKHLVRVTQAIHSKASSAGIREFARAFNIKKDR